MATTIYPPDYLESRPLVSPVNIEKCQHCGADYTALRRITCWEWQVGRAKKALYEGGYVAACITCGRETRIEWQNKATPRRPLLRDRARNETVTNLRAMQQDGDDLGSKRSRRGKKAEVDKEGGRLLL